jgi:predicted CoA-binding protein
MTNTSQPSDEDLVTLYRSLRTIAVVGASANETKPAYLIPVRPAAPQR